MQEAGRAAAMLDVGLALPIRGGEKDARLGRDEACKLGRDASLPGAALLHAPVAVARALAGLQSLDRRRERHVTGIGGADIHDCSFRGGRGGRCREVSPFQITQEGGTIWRYPLEFRKGEWIAWRRCRSW